MSKEREELNKKKAEQKKKNTKSNLLKAGGILVSLALAVIGANKKSSQGNS